MANPPLPTQETNVVDGPNFQKVAPPVVLAQPPPGGLVPTIRVTVKSMKANDPGIEYRMRVSQTFKRVYYDYAEKVDRLTTDFKFRNVNGVILDTDTPATAGILNGDVLFFVQRIRTSTWILGSSNSG